MGKTTDNLIKLANDAPTTQPGCEMDMLITTPRAHLDVAACMALADLGIEAMSFTGSQAGIITDSTHNNEAPRSSRLKQALRDGLAAARCVVAVSA